ncbi:MAG: hypothetical protein LBU65_03180 [Planctomycetaceae bacterium]|jgi:predicted peptidase|nr:hypothetical protein [Planctomycetaceae bacterium]
MKALFSLLTFFLLTFSVFAAEMSTQVTAVGKQVVQTAVLPANIDNRKPATSAERKKNMLALEPLRETETQTISYLLFLPNKYKPTGKKFPLLLFLHGSGSRGNNIDKVKGTGLAKILTDPDKANDWQFITVSPQCPGDYS